MLDLAAEENFVLNAGRAASPSFATDALGPLAYEPRTQLLAAAGTSGTVFMWKRVKPAPSAESWVLQTPAPEVSGVVESIGFGGASLLAVRTDEQVSCDAIGGLLTTPGQHPARAHYAEVLWPQHRRRPGVFLPAVARPRQGSPVCSQGSPECSQGSPECSQGSPECSCITPPACPHVHPACRLLPIIVPLPIFSATAHAGVVHAAGGRDIQEGRACAGHGRGHQGCGRVGRARGGVERTTGGCVRVHPRQHHPAPRWLVSQHRLRHRHPRADALLH
jgi:hypothetical protein